jgi:hypothetical protein
MWTTSSSLQPQILRVSSQSELCATHFDSNCRIPASRMRCLACAAPATAAAARAPGRRFGRRRVVVDCAASADRSGEGTPPRSVCLSQYFRNFFWHIRSSKGQKHNQTAAVQNLPCIFRFIIRIFCQFITLLELRTHESNCIFRWQLVLRLGMQMDHH